MKNTTRETRVLDMTQGNPVRLILAFAIPLFMYRECIATRLDTISP